ncbi:DUF3180 domain-containing protein [Longispora albida]|uniref:DUF3180 domain-containing protein n=1 Tax=Longispora albida TaxID=203523 RepID=UPI00037946BC|nr:DUF3180 domain-containing protein [Longispora albida]
MTEPTPSLRPTSAATLFVAGLGTAALVWVLIDRYYGDFPRLTWLPALTLGLLACAEAYAAWTTRARIARKPGAAPLEPLTVARFAVLAKASSLAGAICTGGYGAIALWLWATSDRLTAANQDLPGALLGFGASAALLAAALWLEHSCRIPPETRDVDEGPSLN